MKKLIAILSALVLVLSLCACNVNPGNNNTQTPPSDTYTPPPDNNTPTPNETQAAPNETPESTDKPVNTPDSSGAGGDLSSSYNGIDIAVLSVKEYPADAIKEDYPDVTPVENGYKWVLVEIELVNGGEKEIGYEEEYKWDFYIHDSDGTDQTPKTVYMRNLGDDVFDLTSALAPGQSRSGKLGFILKKECESYTFWFRPFERREDDTKLEIVLKGSPSGEGPATPNNTPVIGDVGSGLSTSYKGIDLKILGFTEYPGDTIKGAYPDVTPVENGYKWVLVDVELVNGGDTEIGYEEEYKWDFYIHDSDGTDQTPQNVYMRNLKGDQLDLTSVIAPGQSRSGKLGFILKKECETYTFWFRPFNRREDDTKMELVLR